MRPIYEYLLSKSNAKDVKEQPLDNSVKVQLAIDYLTMRFLDRCESYRIMKSGNLEIIIDNVNVKGMHGKVCHRLKFVLYLVAEKPCVRLTKWDEFTDYNGNACAEWAQQPTNLGYADDYEGVCDIFLKWLKKHNINL